MGDRSKEPGAKRQWQPIAVTVIQQIRYGREGGREGASSKIITHTNEMLRIATAAGYLDTALATVVALTTEPSSSDNGGSGRHKKKKKNQ